MPMPVPKDAETKDEFLKRCMADDVMNQDYPASNQRYAVCNSIWKKGDNVSKNKELETVDISNVEVLAVGTWKGSTGPVTFKTEDLDRIVESYNAISGDKELNYEPPVKLGHDDSQKLLQKDGYPAAGWVASLKRTGDKLVADLKDVPKKLGDIIKAGGYKKVSSEVYRDYEIGGKKYGLVLKAIALLGGDVPAVKTLQDIVAQYGEDEPVEAVMYEMAEGEVTLDEIMSDLDTWLSKAESTIKGKAGSPAIRTYLKEVKSKLKALIKDGDRLAEDLQRKVDGVHRAWHDRHSGSIDEAYRDRGWICEVYDSHVIVQNGEKYYKIPYSVSETGEHVFDMANAVQVERVYQEIQTKDKEALMEEEIRKLLELGEDADVLEAVRALKESKATEPEPASKSVALSEHEAVKAEVTALKTKLAERDRDEAVAHALSEGKITPAQKEWADRYALNDPAGFKAFVESAPVAVELGERGTSGQNDPGVELTAAEIALGEKMGVSREDLIAAKQQG